MTTFEQLLPTEDRDIQEIVAGILHAQQRFAGEQKRPLGRGTHTKGVCVRGTFEVLPGLDPRLAKGLYAHPGVYQATVRFANAESTIKPDDAPDVRAMSFAVEVPAGVLGPDATRVDFSMNSTPVFTINDAHAFATLMRVLEADGRWGKLKALASLSPREFAGLIRIGRLAKQQKKHSVRPYQTLRYWSTVPFRHGPDDAVKYSATAQPSNPADAPGTGANVLRDDLVRHLAGGREPMVFDFGLQLLDADAMRHKGRTKPATFWVENASVEWPESEAPFHTVGRLTLTPDSHLDSDACDAFYIDVTEHATADGHPLGSINRARWFAEAASRRARLGEPAPHAVPHGQVVNTSVLPAAREGAPRPAPAAPMGTWIGRLTLHSVMRAAMFAAIGVFGLVTLFSVATMTYLHFGGGMLPATTVDSVTYAAGGWGAGVEDPDRQRYYYTPQGAGLKDVRYSWFVHLEMPLGRTRLADPSIMRRYGFLVDEATPRNPDQLPVGFTRHFDTTLNEELLDITCAACHTGQIQVTRDGRTRALRIDGGQALHAFTDSNPGHFLPTMVASMAATATNPLKFARFARKVLGDTYPEGRWELHRQLREVIATFAGIVWNDKVHKLSPTEEGYGRTDALARISNTVFAENLVALNYVVGNAPVSFPPVWNIWKFDWVQYNASVSQPMARNIGESMGVGAKYALVDKYGRPLPAEERFRSTSNIYGLRDIENTLWKLEPPQWREDILGPIDQTLASHGKELFDKYCVQCHGPHIAPPAIKLRNAPLKGPDEPEWLVRTVCVDDIGTDPNTALNFVNSKLDIRRTGLTAEDLRAVARKGLEAWNARQRVYLQGEIDRLRLSLVPEDLQTRSRLEQELAGLDDVMEHTLSQIDPGNLSLGAALSYLGTMIREKAYEDLGLTADEQAVLDGFGILDMPQVIYAYKPRPLGGMWATAPFLHNGSVPTVWDLLSPVEQRPATFQVGSQEYDTQKLGLAPATGYWEFNTRLSGNHNTGHEFADGWVEGHRPTGGKIGPKLHDDEKRAIIEHLKVRNDDVDGPPEPRIPVTRTASGEPCKVTIQK
jgi:hypothetical protein